MKLPPLYLIADPIIYKQGAFEENLDAFFQSLREAIAGGLRFVQYRDKFRPRNEMFQIAKQVREITRQGDALLIINDEIDLAMAIEADGVHLGQDDFPVSMARRLLGKNAVIGLSTHSLPQALEAAKEAIDYIGFGPIFSSTTKQAHAPTIGVSKISALREHLALPIYAIGGIQFPQLRPIIEAGASGVAVAGALKGANKKMVSEWQETLEQSLKSQ